jgi:hypothetical protein
LQGMFAGLVPRDARERLGNAMEGLLNAPRR